jgi:hypothetical protein
MKYLRRVLGNGLVVIEVPSSDAGSVVVIVYLYQKVQNKLKS